MPSTDPTFEEGPFFLVEGTTISQLGKKAIVWATDESAACGAYGWKIPGRSSMYAYATLIGDLTALKRKYRLTPQQITDLHRDGYLKL